MKTLKSISLCILCAFLTVGCCLLSACGKDPNHIKINEVTRSIFYAPLYAALNLGYFEDEGLSVDIESNDGSHTSMAILLSGNCDIALVGPETVVYSTETKDSPKVFGQLTQRDGSFIVSKTELDGDFNLDMLKGKTIIGGREGGLPAMTLQYIIEKVANLTIGTGDDEVNLRTDVQFADIGAEFQKTTNEFCTLFEPTATTLASEKGYSVVAPVGEYSGLVPYTCFVAKESYLKKYNTQAEKFLKAVKRAYDFITDESNLDKSAEALMKSFPSMSKDELKIAIKSYSDIEAWSASPVMQETSFDRLLEIINNASAKKYTATFAECVDNTIASKIA